MNIIKHFTIIKKRIITNNVINKIIKHIKKSHINAYTIGKEIMYIYSILYNIFKHAFQVLGFFSPSQLRSSMLSPHPKEGRSRRRSRAMCRC